MILQRLKQATRERHVALESRSILLDPALSRDAYRDCLCRFFGYYEPLELKLMSAPFGPYAALVNVQRHKAPLLALDLTRLGLAPHALAQLARCQALPDLSTTARVLGCLYVLEGATLGGQLVLRHLSATLALTPDCGGAFFGGDGAQTGSRWKAFGSQLTAFADGSTCDDDIVAGANDTFETLDHWLYPPLPPRSPINESAHVE